jgi:hypothetical protein
MRIRDTRTKNLGSRIGKGVAALVVASTIGGVCIAPAFGKDKDNHNGYYDHGQYRYERGRRVYGAPPRRYYPPPAPVYAPPPVIYYTPAPYQSPGISLFFPIRIW